MTVLSRGARVRRGGRRPGWVLLTALLVLAMGASSALVFTNRVELLKLAVILALWAAVAGAFVSVLYRRQSDADQSRVRDLKLVYDLQLDREISARREYELTVESQLRRELASELRAQAAEDLAELRAELTALRTSLEILFDTDLQHRPALYGDWERNGETNADWVSSDRVTSVTPDRPADGRADETSIIDVPIDVPEEPLLPPRRERSHYDARPYMTPPQAPAPPPPQPEPQPQLRDWQRPPPNGETPRRQHGFDEPPVEPAHAPPYGETGRRARARHAVEYGAYGAPDFAPANEPAPPHMAPPPHAEPAPRHRGIDPLAQGQDDSADAPPSGGQSVAELLARLQVEPSGGGRRTRRESRGG